MRNLNMPFVVGVMLAATLIGAGTGWAQAPAGWAERSINREVSRLTLLPTAASSFLVRQQSQPKKQNWIQRHPALFGALVGFGGGFLIGYLPGDDAVFDDFQASFNGLVIGGVGALAGAIVGEVTVD